jgi:hypothetical protein
VQVLPDDLSGCWGSVDDDDAEFMGRYLPSSYRRDFLMKMKRFFMMLLKKLH